jgi:hypothetical protein
MGNRFGDISEWARQLGALDGGAVAVRGEKNHREVEFFPNPCGCIDPIDRSVDPDVHQNNVGCRRMFQRFLGRTHGRHYLMAQRFQTIRDVQSDQPLIFHY